MAAIFSLPHLCIEIKTKQYEKNYSTTCFAFTNSKLSK
jgi:hypothetical protein